MKSFKEFFKEANLASLMRTADRAQPKKDTSSNPEVHNKPRLKVADKAPLWKRLGGKNEEYIYSHRDKWIIATNHSTQRTMERSSLSTKEMKSLFDKVIDKTITDKLSSRMFLFYSKSLRQGIIVDHRPDKKGLFASSKNQIIIATFLPRGKEDIRKNDNGVTQKVIVEEFYNDCSNSFMQYLSFLMEQKEEMLLEEDADYCYTIKPLIFENTTIELVLCENKFLHLKNMDIIEID